MNIVYLIAIIIVIIIIIFVCRPTSTIYPCFNANNRYMIQYTNKHIVDKVFVINLEKNKKRFEQFMGFAKRANVNVERFNAIYGKQLPKDHDYIKKHFVKTHKLNQGQIGCALSHYKIWENVVQNSFEHIIIFEDDAIIPYDFWKQFNAVYQELPKNWDMLLLTINTGFGDLYSEKLIKLKKCSGNWGLIGYLINIKFINKILKNKIDRPIDKLLRDKYYYDSKYNIYLANPSIIGHDYSFYSDNFDRFRTSEEKKRKKVFKHFHFLHIPKCGGTSFKKKFRKNILFSPHCKARAIDNIYNIAIIRNPYERFVSIFRHIKDRESETNIEKMANDLLYFTNIEEFCNAYFNKDHQYHKKVKHLLNWKNVKIKSFCKHFGCNWNDKCIHWAPQSYFVNDISKIQALINLDSIDEDIKRLYDKHILDDFYIPKVNVSKYKKFEISPIVKRLVDTVYRDDFILYKKAGIK